MRALVRRLIFGSAVVAAAIAAASVHTSHIETEVTIAAPPGHVWAVLADGPAYPAWNPFIRRMDGELVAGTRLTIELTPAEGRPMTFEPQVLRADGPRELRWLGRLWFPGLLDGEHYFILEPAAGGRTRLRHGEYFTGLLSWWIDPVAVRAEFERVNRALAMRAVRPVPPFSER